MSKIGKMPIKINEDVTIICSNYLNPKDIIVSGKLGEIKININTNKIYFEKIEDFLYIKRKEDIPKIKALHGLYRQLINNAIIGVDKGYTYRIIVRKAMYNASINNNILTLNVGYSNPILFTPPEGIQLICIQVNNKNDIQIKNIIEVKGINKELVGNIAAKIKKFRPVEPYHKFGMYLENEKVLTKKMKGKK